MTILHNGPVAEFNIPRVALFASVIRGGIHLPGQPLGLTGVFFKELEP